jgi:hypothetical protein
LITCHLTKLETAVEQIKKTHPKLKPCDSALLASALVLTGRHALALYEGEHFTWPDDYEKLTKKMVSQLQMISDSVEPVKKTKTAVEEEPLTMSVGLMPNFSAGERLLSNRADLKAKLSQLLQEGVEYVYSPTDLGWQWALDRANWATVSGGDLTRRVKIRSSFTEGAVGIEMGSAAKKRPTKKTAKPIDADASAAAEQTEDEKSKDADVIAAIVEDSGLEAELGTEAETESNGAVTEPV